jgi:hypothetical protein
MGIMQQAADNNKRLQHKQSPEASQTAPPTHYHRGAVSFFRKEPCQWVCGGSRQVELEIVAL